MSPQQRTRTRLYLLGWMICWTLGYWVGWMLVLDVVISLAVVLTLLHQNAEGESDAPTYDEASTLHLES